MAHRGRLNVLAHIVGRPYETIFAEFEGGRVEADSDARGRHRRREVPPRRRGRVPAPSGDVDHGHADAQPQPPRVRLAGRRGRAPRQADPAPRPDAHHDTDAAHPGASSTATPPSPDRASWPRRSTCSALDGYASAARSTSSPTTRSASPPTSRGRALHPLRLRPRQGLRHPDHPRQRRRPGGLPRRGAAGDGLPRASSTRTCSSTWSATAATATTRPTSRPTPSRSCTSGSRTHPRCASSTPSSSSRPRRGHRRTRRDDEAKAG